MPDRPTAPPERLTLVLGTSGGGVGRHVRAVAAGLAARGSRVTVLGPASTEEAFGFTVAGAGFVAVDVADRPRPRADAAAVRRLRLLLGGSEVVHAHGLRAGGLAALALTGLRRRPVLAVTLHNARLAGGVVGAAYAVLERVVARRADAVLGVSADLADRMRALGARDVRHAVVPAPVTGEPLRDRARVRAELGVAPNRPVVLTVARLAEQKGLDLLLDAAARWARSGPGAASVPGPVPLFAVAGDGPLAPALRARVERERLPVALLGRRADVPDLLAAADLAVVPSRWEGQPIFAQEALRAGVPLVATATGGTPQVVGDAAVLVPYADPDRLATEVARLIADDGARAGLAARGRARAAQLPTEDDAVDAVLELYAALRGRPAGR